MLKNVNDPKELQRFLLSLLSTSGTMAGLSLALAGIVNLKIANTKVQTLADDMFFLSALGFIFVCYLVFFTLRQVRSGRVRYWANVIDIVFLSSLTLLLVAGFMSVYVVV